ncbi:right-handed parallel beta-helix repeat-containing protein [Sphingomonas sp. PAMC 26621]|uniref:right-handed parallel beta-helix repeat-containing protein n=1 Tax=Sphingomonas sp. PAMC 26621 TaxID=1112213 RepID=UPI0014783E16|nr:right-handed parallel beta-helix repeat-containing protein [Sphingomonas sp. PAMC 26621]
MPDVKIVAFLIGFMIAAPASARDWFVSPSGDDRNVGATSNRPFQTLEKAALVVAAGDTVWLGGGTYSGAETDADLLGIRTPGRAGAWITWRALPGQTPVLRPRGWAGIDIRASYQIIDGVTVLGGNDAIRLSDAIADAKQSKARAYFNTNGIIIDGRHEPTDAKPHHIIIRHCEVAKMPGGGITALQADYVTIVDNLVHDNAWFMRYAGSGISLLNDWAHDDRSGYHVMIRRNRVWDNKTLVPWERTGKLSDGNGIILDVTDPDDPAGATNPNGDLILSPQRSAPTDATKRPPWTGRALVADNVSAFNGGSGIHTFRTAHVDITGNTTYWNGAVVGYAELFANRSRDITITNNVIVPRPGGNVTSNNRNTDVRWDHNMYPAAEDILRGPHDVVATPHFVRVNSDLRRADFRVEASGSADTRERLTRDSRGD